MMTVQCPKCELRFWTKSEALWQLRQDHRRSAGLGPPDRRRGPTRLHHRQGWQPRKPAERSSAGGIRRGRSVQGRNCRSTGLMVPCRRSARPWPGPGGR
jgi:hypothetical protein